MSTEAQAYEYLIKILIVGDSSVGKTCILLRYCEDKFSTSHLPTIGIDFKIKKLDVDDSKIKIQIWDTAGQERFKTITQNYYKGAHGIILTYAVDDKDSLSHIENWIRQTKVHAPEDICKVLVGNKSDSPDRTVTYEEGKRIGDEFGIPFFETSAKDGRNINDTFYSIAKMIKDQLIEKEKSRTNFMSGKDGKLKLTPDREGSKSKSVCC